MGGLLKQPFENNLHAGFDYSGKVHVETESMLPYQCKPETCDDDETVTSGEQCVKQTKDDDADYDITEFKNPMCHAYFEKIQNNARFAKFKDVTEDMQRACWLPQTVSALESSSAAANFMERSDLNVSVYPLKYNVDDDEAREAGKHVYVCFIFGRNEDEGKFSASTDDTFTKGGKSRRFLVCYNDINESGDMPRSKSGANNLWGDSDTNTRSGHKPAEKQFALALVFVVPRFRFVCFERTP